jgi:transcriptional regulator with XRE-family HTH domain
MSKKQTLGSRINELRVEKRIGVRELGRLVDISAMHISNIEKGKSSASPELIRKIAKALEADADELLALSDQVDPDVVDVINANHTQVPSFLRAAKNLTPEQWETLQKQVEKMTRK